MRLIENKQRQFISLVKNYFNICEKKAITSSISPKCYITTWTRTRGYFKLMEIIGKKSLNGLIYTFKDILAISTLYDYDLTYGVRKKKNKNLLISYCTKNSFDKNGNFTDSYFNLKSLKNNNSWLLISLDGFIPKELKENIYIFYKKSKNNFSIFFLFKTIFSIIINNLFNFKKISHYVSKQYVFTQLINNHYNDQFEEQSFKNVIINYEGIPFQHSLINSIKKINNKTKIICYLHCAGWPLQTDLIYREKSIDLFLVSGEDQRKNLVKNLGWPARKVKVIPSLRFSKSKDEFSGYLFVPYELSNFNLQLKIFENYLQNLKNKTINQLKLRIHPLNKESKKHIVFANRMNFILKKYKKKFCKNTNKKTSIIFGSATGVSLQALEDGVKIIHFPKDKYLDVFTKKMWPNINVKNLGDDIFSYEIIKKNSIFWVKKNNASYDKYILPELKK